MLVEQAIGEAINRHSTRGLTNGDYAVIGLHVWYVLGISYEQLGTVADQIDSLAKSDRRFRGFNERYQTLREHRGQIALRARIDGLSREEAIDEENILLRAKIAARRLRMHQIHGYTKDLADLAKIPLNESNRIDAMTDLCATVVVDVCERMMPSPRYGILVFNPSSSGSPS